MHFIFLPNSKIQKYSPTESAKIYDKAVNRKSTVHFNPRQTLDFISNNIAHATLTNDIKKRIVKQYLDVSRRVSPGRLSVHCFLAGIHQLNKDDLLRHACLF